MAAKIIELFIKKALFKKGGAMANNQAVKFSADALEKRLKDLGIDPNSINSEAELNQILAYVKQAEDQAFNQLYGNVLSGDDAANFLKNAFKLKNKNNVVDMTGKTIDTSEGIIGGKSVKELLESGEVTKGTVTKQSDKVKDRTMFKDANKRFNKTDIVADSIAKITSMEPVAAMKEANKIIKREGIYKNLDETQSKKILTDTEDWIFQRDKSDLYDYKKNRPFRDDPNFDPDDPDFDPENMAQGGIAKFYTGGMVDVEPNLSDIGHGSDALMARTRLLSPNAQATTSTGLNYLLAEDNDNIRVPFSKGKLALKKLNEGRRKFMKTAGTGLAGLAALKTGLINLAEEAGPKIEAVKETVSKVPPYFFRLVEKIRAMGDETLPSQDKAIAKKYKDYVMEEDFAGNITIMKSGEDLQGNKLEDVYMSYKVDDVALKNKDGFARVDEYEEFTARPDMEGKMKDVEPGVPDEVIEEAGEIDSMTLKKADGGRIGYSKGKAVLKGIEEFLAGLKINSTTSRFLEKIFGKEAMAEMPKKDPDLFKGLLEVTEMYRKRDREGLKKYMKNYLPDMDDVEIEEFIKGNPEISGMSGELIRLGSGRDYAGKLDMMKRANEMRKLDDLDVTEEMIRKPNASGGLAKLLGE